MNGTALYSTVLDILHVENPPFNFFFQTFSNLRNERTQNPYPLSHSHSTLTHSQNSFKKNATSNEMLDC
jgi:hypothetical protein